MVIIHRELLNRNVNSNHELSLFSEVTIVGWLSDPVQTLTKNARKSWTMVDNTTAVED